MTKQALTATMLTTLFLTGCDSILYSGSSAPVYSSTTARRNGTQQAPPRIPVTTTPTATTQTGQTVNTTTPSIERPGNSSVIVNSSQNNPYSTVATQTADGIEAQAQTVNDAAQTAANQPVIREGTEVLKATQQVERPNAVKTQVEQTTTQVANQATEQINNEAQTAVKNASQSVNTTVQQVENTTTATTTVAATTTAATTTAATTVAKTAPATPQSATQSLLKEAHTAVSQGDLGKAASSLERAHRIEPGNAKILYDIAQIRYAQGKYRQAEAFAIKASSNSSSSSLSKKIWSLVSNARKAQGNTSGAAMAAKKAASL